jgi:hypothetical protein
MPAYQAAGFFAETAQYLYELDPQPERYVFCENNSTDDTLRMLWGFKRPREVIRLWFRDDAADVCVNEGLEMMAITRQFLLQRARQLNPDFAIFLDADISVLSSDLIDRLNRWGDLGIVGGIYFRRDKYAVYSSAGALSGSRWSPLSPVELPKLVPSAEGPRGVGLEVAWLAGGCVMLPRRVIQDKRLNYWPMLPKTFEDSGYCVQARQLGYKVFADLSISLDHPVALHDAPRPWDVDEGGVQVKGFHYGGA